jgi:hypothetical protein
MKLSYLVTASVLAVGLAQGAPLKSANLTKKVNNVRISESSRQAREAQVGDKLTGSSTVLTGRQSRAELTFPDKTITRIGANAAFSFSSGSRDMAIQQGSFLLQVPKGAGGATIRTSTVTAAITGTTTMMEYNPGKWLKFICLEGTAKLKNKKGDTVEVPPGRMIAMHPDADQFPPPFIVNVKKMMETSALTDEETFEPLNDEAENAIDDTMAGQMNGKRDGTLQPGYILDRRDQPVGGADDGGGSNPPINDLGEKLISPNTQLDPNSNLIRPDPNTPPFSSL